MTAEAAIIVAGIALVLVARWLLPDKEVSPWE
jgi:hypothetical protein